MSNLKEDAGKIWEKQANEFVVSGKNLKSCSVDAMIEFATHQHNVTIEKAISEITMHKSFLDDKVSKLKNAMHPYDEGRLSGFEASSKCFADLIQAIKQLQP